MTGAKRLRACRYNHVTRIQAAGHLHGGRILRLYLDGAHGYGPGLRIHDPHCASAFGTHQCRGRYFDADGGIELHPSRDGTAETHGRGWIVERYPHCEGTGHRIRARCDFPHPTAGFYGWIAGQRHGDFRIGRRAVLDLRRNAEHRIACACACNLDDRASCRYHFARFCSAARNDAGRFGNQLGIAQPVLCKVDLRLRRLDLRLRRLQHGNCLVERGPRHGVLGYQVAHAGIIVLRLDQLRPRCRQLRPCR